MTPKQQRFVEEYLIDLNATRACIRAGYSERTADRIGPELLGKTCVAAAIAEAKAKRSAETAIDARWVLLRAVEMHQACKDAKDSTNALRALDIVGKHVDVQAFKERVEHSGALLVEQVQTDADAFASRIASLAARDGPSAGDGTTQH